MKKFTLKATRIGDLINVLDALNPQDMAKIKQDDPTKYIARKEKIIEEMKAANKEYSELVEKRNAPIITLQRDFKKEFDKLEGNTEEETKKLKEELVTKFNAKINKISEEQTKKLKMEEAGDKEVEVTINSDEKFELLKDLFNDKTNGAFLKFNVTKPVAEIYDALESARGE